MKRIELFTSLAGPDGSMAPGEQEVSDKLAKALVDGGHAKILGNVVASKPKPVEVETAEDQQEKREEAVQPRKRRGRRRGGR